MSSENSSSSDVSYEKRVRSYKYKCCPRKFKTSQALGGHQRSHKKVMRQQVNHQPPSETARPQGDVGSSSFPLLQIGFDHYFQEVPTIDFSCKFNSSGGVFLFGVDLRAASAPAPVPSMANQEENLANEESDQGVDLSLHL